MALGTDNMAPDNLDSIERLMVEVGHARQAGVFARTCVDVSALLTRRPANPSWFRRHRQALVGLPVAACLMLTALLGIHYAGQSSAPDTTAMLTNSYLANSYDVLTSQAVANRLVESIPCFTGPGGGPVGPECVAADMDADGDVDLRDMSALQLEARPSP